MANKELVEKYAGSPEEMEREQDELETEVAIISKELEQKIRGFSKKTDTLTVDGEVLAYVQRPSASQFDRLFPQQLAKYRKKPEDIPFEVAKKYETDMYELMGELIVNPKHEVKWWKENTGDEFMAAFQAHVFNVRQKLQENIENFLEPT